MNDALNISISYISFLRRFARWLRWDQTVLKISDSSRVVGEPNPALYPSTALTTQEICLRAGSHLIHR
jgi:hypothetical protein